MTTEEEMNTALLITTVKCIAAVIAGVLEGNGAVYFFNRIPPKWLCDYNEEPSAELLDKFTQRVKSYPWKYIFTMLFIVLNIKLVIDDWEFAIPASVALFLMLELSIADKKYGIVPDQLLILLSLTGIGFFPYNGSWKEILVGAVVGFGLVGGIALIGKLAYRRDTIGGGDIKLFTVLGFMTGMRGVLIIFAAMAIISSAHFVWLMARKKINRKDTVPIVPYIALSAGAYIVFFWELGRGLIL